MTRKTVVEYAKAIRERYRMASKADKGRILDEFCQTSGYNRKAAIRLLGGDPVTERRHGGGRTPYGPEVREVVGLLWEAADRICGKRLAPFIPELLQMLERAGELTVAPVVRAQVLGVSAATIDRLVAPARLEGRRPHTQSRAAVALKALVPVRTFGEWKGVAPGAFQADLVAHCGESTAGFYLNTLMAVDVATGWTECEAVWGKGQRRVGTGVHHIRERVPMLLQELHTDNGGEFVNHVLYPWCQQEGIRLTRGRPYRKNDQAYAEQKNGAVVRRLVGYDRYSSKAAYAELQRLYRLVRPYVNFCQPLRKLVGKERVGSKTRKRFDQAKTPYQRLLATDVLGEEQRQRIDQEYRAVNPVRLRAHIQISLKRLWDLAEGSTPGLSTPTPGQRMPKTDRGRRATAAPPAPVSVGASAP